MTHTPEDLAGAVLSINLVALQENWRTLQRHAAPAECGAAVKGNAYGLGIAPVARALWEAGCRSFFVARPKEGEELRAYFGIVVIGWITAGIIFVEKLLTIIRGKMEISAFKKNHPTLFDAMNDAGCHLLLY